jgi:hypothetical protein
MSLSASWKRSLNFFYGRLVRRAVDFLFLARFAITSPVGPLKSACPDVCVMSKVPIGQAEVLAREELLEIGKLSAWSSKDASP